MPANTPSPVPAEQRASYAAIIDEILANADLETISAKRIRNGLQERVEYDLTPQKVGLIDWDTMRAYH
jgi:upstream activation factor subunit UAF30